MMPAICVLDWRYLFTEPFFLTCCVLLLFCSCLNLRRKQQQPGTRDFEASSEFVIGEKFVWIMG